MRAHLMYCFLHSELVSLSPVIPSYLKEGVSVGRRREVVGQESHIREVIQKRLAAQHPGHEFEEDASQAPHVIGLAYGQSLVARYTVALWRSIRERVRYVSRTGPAFQRIQFGLAEIRQLHGAFQLSWHAIAIFEPKNIPGVDITMATVLGNGLACYVTFVSRLTS